MENFKDIVVDGRTFRLNKLDARKGSFMLMKLVKILTPLLKGVNVDDIMSESEAIEGEKKEEKSFLDNISIEDLANSLFDLEEDEFVFIQDNALKVVQEVLSARNAPVLDANGNYGVIGIEFDTMLLLNLTVQSIKFNVAGFFKGGFLSSALKESTSLQQNS